MHRLALLLLLAGCTIAPTAQPDASLRQVARDDIAAAIEQAANDPVALKCWQSVAVALDAPGAGLPVVKGAASAIQAKRNLKGKTSTLLPSAVKANCSELYVEEHFAVERDMLMFLVR